MNSPPSIPSPPPRKRSSLLIELYDAAIDAQRHALERFFSTRVRLRPKNGRNFAIRSCGLPTGQRRSRRSSSGPMPSFRGPASTRRRSPSRRSSGAICSSSCNPLVRDYGATHRGRRQRPGNPLPLCVRARRRARRGARSSAAELAQSLSDAPALAGRRRDRRRHLGPQSRASRVPLSLFDAVRVDYSLRRLVHYTGTDWRAVQPWILLTNYHRYVDQFVRWATGAARDENGPFEQLDPAGRRHDRARPGAEADRRA